MPSARAILIERRRALRTKHSRRDSSSSRYRHLACEFLESRQLLAASTTGIISGAIWSDTNSNGKRDSGEAGLSGWTVFLDTDKDGVKDTGETSATTSSTGAYSFTVTAGTYTVREVLQSGYTRTTPSVGYYSVSVTAGGSATGKIFGNIKSTGTIAGTVFNDTDRDGVVDSGESGLSGWTVFLDTDGDGVKDTGETSATTSSTGAYSFTVTAGTYTVREVLQSGYTRTTPSVGYYSVSVTAGGSATGKIFGNIKSTGTIAGTVFNDTDRDGVVDSGESGLSGWTVFLDTDGDGVKDTGETSATTSSTGAYSFTVTAGTYTVREVLQSGYTRTTPSVGYYSVSVTAGASVTGKIFGNKTSSSTGTTTPSSATSTNWSGYAAVSSAGAVTYVCGTWVVPTVTGTGTTYSSVWVGIDGYDSDTVEQIGTEQDIVNGKAVYSAWYEMYPDWSIDITTLTISAGDTITASVTYASGRFVLSITDVTTGKSFTTTQTLASAERSSAEWVVEAPSDGTSTLTLSNFGTATFTSCYATISGVTGPIDCSSWSSVKINMTNSSGTLLDTTSSLTDSSSKSSFTVTYKTSTSNSTASRTSKMTMNSSLVGVGREIDTSDALSNALTGSTSPSTGDDTLQSSWTSIVAGAATDGARLTGFAWFTQDENDQAFWETTSSHEDAPLQAASLASTSGLADTLDSTSRQASHFNQSGLFDDEAGSGALTRTENEEQGSRLAALDFGLSIDQDVSSSVTATIGSQHRAIFDLLAGTFVAGNATALPMDSAATRRLFASTELFDEIQVACLGLD